jgi:hypothetical protein
MYLRPSFEKLTRIREKFEAAACGMPAQYWRMSLCGNT